MSNDREIIKVINSKELEQQLEILFDKMEGTVKKALNNFKSTLGKERMITIKFSSQSTIDRKYDFIYESEMDFGSPENKIGLIYGRTSDDHNKAELIGIKIDRIFLDVFNDNLSNKEIVEKIEQSPFNEFINKFGFGDIKKSGKDKFTIT
jgi:hypothetical protein